MKTMASQVIEEKKKAAQVWAVANGGTLFSGEELTGDFLASFV